MYGGAITQVGHAGLVELLEPPAPSPLVNPDLAPTPVAGRTWGRWHIASLWVGLSVCIPTYMLAAGMIQMAISRTREYDADEDGSTLTGDPLALASALRKLEIGVSQAPLAPHRDIVNASHMMIANPFRAQDVSRLMSTHPPMAERIARLEQMAYGYRANP